MVLGASAASGQSYPNKPIRIVTGVTGGSLDLTARLIAPKVADGLRQQVVVDNRGGIISMEIVAKAPADGYTLLLAAGKDFAPLELVPLGSGLAFCT